MSRIYYGIKPLPKYARLPTIDEAFNANQIKRYGKIKVDKSKLNRLINDLINKKTDDEIQGYKYDLKFLKQHYKLLENVEQLKEGDLKKLNQYITSRNKYKGEFKNFMNTGRIPEHINEIKKVIEKGIISKEKRINKKIDKVK